MKSGNAGDAVVGCGLLAFALYFWTRAQSLPTGMDDIPGPALFPQIILIGLFATALWLLLRNLRLPVRRLGRTLWQERGSFMIVAGLAGVIALYAFALAHLPFTPATFAFIVAAAAIVRRFELRWRLFARIAVLALVSAAAIEAVFLYGLNIRL